MTTSSGSNTKLVSCPASAETPASKVSTVVIGLQDNIVAAKMLSVLTFFMWNLPFGFTRVKEFGIYSTK